MHGIFSGLMGFFMGFAAFFHHGSAVMPNTNQSQTVQQSTIFGTPPASPSGTMRGRGFGRGRGMKIPQGDKPFFGIVTAVNGSTLTLQMQMPMMRERFTNPSITPAAPQTLTIDLTSSTTYTGGSQSDITNNTRIVGYGSPNSDGSINAIQVRINPTIPSGFPRRFQNNQNGQGNNY